MKRIKTLYVISSLIWIGLSSCGGTSDYDDVQADIRNKAEKLRSVYNQVVGTYQGQLTSPTRSPLDVQLTLYIQDQQAGQDSNGAPITRPVLRALFQLVSVIHEMDDIILDVDYDPLTGSTSFVVFAEERINRCTVGPRDPLFSMKATITSDRRLIGTTRRAMGTWGSIQLNFKGESVNFVPSPEVRLQQAYAELAGVYRGTYRGICTPELSGCPDRGRHPERIPFRFELKVNPKLVRVEGGLIACPALTGDYFREDMSDPHIGRLPVEALYNPWSQQLIITSTPSPSNNSSSFNNEGGFNGELPPHRKLTYVGEVKMDEGVRIVDGHYDWFGRQGSVRLYPKRLSLREF